MNGRILVIDDEPDMCSLLERVLMRKGFDVTTSTNALDALDLVRRETFVLFIVDLRMPVMNGLEFVKRVRQEGNKSRCIIITAFPTIDALREAKEQGVSDFLVKPLNIQELEDAVARAVDF